MRGKQRADRHHLRPEQHCAQPAGNLNAAHLLPPLAVGGQVAQQQAPAGGPQRGRDAAPAQLAQRVQVHHLYECGWVRRDGRVMGLCSLQPYQLKAKRGACNKHRCRRAQTVGSLGSAPTTTRRQPHLLAQQAVELGYPRVAHAAQHRNLQPLALRLHILLAVATRFVLRRCTARAAAARL